MQRAEPTLWVAGFTSGLQCPRCELRTARLIGIYLNLGCAGATCNKFKFIACSFWGDRESEQHHNLAMILNWAGCFRGAAQIFLGIDSVATFLLNSLKSKRARGWHLSAGQSPVASGGREAKKDYFSLSTVHLARHPFPMMMTTTSIHRQTVIYSRTTRYMEMNSMMPIKWLGQCLPTAAAAAASRRLT